MKRLIVIPVMVLYLLAVSGVMFHLHYCGRQLESWNMYAGTSGCDDDACGEDESAPTHKCCKDEVVTAKVSQDHSVSFFKLQLTGGEYILPVNNYTTPQDIVITSDAVHSAHQPNAPPGRWQQIPLYKLHSSLTYYG